MNAFIRSLPGLSGSECDAGHRLRQGGLVLASISRLRFFLRKPLMFYQRSPKEF
jgi:hypothetical protein